MNRLIVQAAIHPKSISRVLVCVERQDGTVVQNLGASNFQVAFWASSASAAGDPPRYWPFVVFVMPSSSGCYELTLDDERYNEDDPSETWHEPLPTNLENVVYVVTVTVDPDDVGHCVVRQPDV